ncbi:hypothetical protein MRX96_016648 [Rhipicephalus microplus]
MRSDTRAGSRRFLLLYASQTGQAEAIARRLNNAALERGFLPDLHCVSAFGREFDLAERRTFESQFDALGATRFYETGYADDAVGLETVVEPWIAELWKALRGAVISGATATTESQEEDPLPIVTMEDGSLTSCSLSASTELTLPLMKDPVVCVRFDSSSAAVKRTTDSDVVWQGGQPLPFQESDVFHVALTSAKRLTSSEKVKEAWELEFPAALTRW